MFPLTAFAENTSSSLDSGLSVRSGDKGDITITRTELSGQKPGGTKDGTWTVLVYMCGADLESEGGAASADIKEMMKASGNGVVNFVIATGGCKEWHFDGTDIDESKIQYYEVRKDGLKLIKDYEHKGKVPNMGDPQSLADFVSWGVANYPAEHTGLILWDHGGGPLNGVCFDELNDSDSLELPELDAALKSASATMWDKFEFIGFDACLMANFEVANYLATYAKYMIASEENEPGNGWDYSGTSDFLKNNKNATGAELGKHLVDAFYQSYDQSFQTQSRSTLSVVDLSRMDELAKAINDFAQDLIVMCGDKNAFANYAKRMDQEYGDYLCGDNSRGTAHLMDLQKLVDAYTYIYKDDKSENRLARAAELLDKLHAAIIETKGGIDIRDACGLTVVYPLPRSYQTKKGTVDTTSIMQKNVQILESVSKTPKYLDFTKSVVGLATSKDAENTIVYKEMPHLTDKGEFTFTLSDTTFVSNVIGYVLQQYSVTDKKTGEQVSRRLVLGETFDVSTDGKGTYTDNFNGKWLCLPDGQPLMLYSDSDAVINKKNNKEYQKYLIPIVLKRGGQEADRFLLLYLDKDGDNGENIIRVLNAETLDDARSASLDTDNQYLLQEGDVIAPLYESFSNSDADGTWYYGSGCSVDKSFDISYQNLPKNRDFYYSFIISDVYRRGAGTDIAKFTINENGKLTFFKDLISTKK